MNYYKNFDFEKAEKLIRLALKEDIGSGDVTSEFLIPNDSVSTAEILVKENGIIAGLKVFEMVFKILDRKIEIVVKKKDGDKVRKGDLVGFVKGNTRKLLMGERVALNILQRMSGIATYTEQLQKKLGNSKTKIIDTRKTTPNMRVFEKAAVLMGRGENHRFGLYDMMLIKDNHIEANGGIDNTLSILKSKKSKTLRKEIEVKNIEELRKVILNGKGIIDRIMLDNFKLSDVKEAVKLINKQYEIEISGGVDESNIDRYSDIKGVDYISIGSLTHSVKSLDISLNFIT